MEQKIDLRIQKTEKAIREAFLDLRRRLPLEKVRVREICQKAMINTSTFYNHYRDVQNLSEQLECELLEDCFSAMPSVDDLFSNPRRFLAELRQIFSDSEQSEALSILFDGRYEAFHQRIDAFFAEALSVRGHFPGGVCQNLLCSGWDPVHRSSSAEGHA